jgi:diaminohydroxyphosphoribosylaminopyrimidine deaminase/5-amino-6-(5-phosphoribosylamino)uracil reductase
MDIAQLVGRDEWAAVNDGGRPFVVYKFAATLDGRIAAADGTSQWITSRTSRSEVHLLRAGCDATVVGSGTQQADDPHLAVRGNDDPRLNLSMLRADRQPWRVVVDSNARTPADARVLDDAAPTLLAVADDADTTHLDGRCELLRIPRARRGLDLRALLAGLLARDVRGVFLEGGPTLAGSFVAAGLVDRVVAYIAPALLGAGRPGLVDAGITSMDDILRLETIDVQRSGPDVRIIARPHRAEGT